MWIYSQSAGQWKCSVEQWSYFPIKFCRSTWQQAAIGSFPCWPPARPLTQVQCGQRGWEKQLTKQGKTAWKQLRWCWRFLSCCGLLSLLKIVLTHHTNWPSKHSPSARWGERWTTTCEPRPKRQRWSSKSKIVTLIWLWKDRMSNV